MQAGRGGEGRGTYGNAAMVASLTKMSFLTPLMVEIGWGGGSWRWRWRWRWGEKEKLEK